MVFLRCSKHRLVEIRLKDMADTVGKQNKLSSIPEYKNEIILSINGIIYNVYPGSHNAVSPKTTLNSFIRNNANLKGTKHMCNEGGCGACVVSVRYKHPVNGQKITLSVNSCLVLVYSCHGWSITTIEGVGNKNIGYNKIQTTLAHFNGTQCGYCTPGFVMNMYSLMESKSNLTMEETEKSFSGHICRCTGYRPILDAFKSLAKDANDELKSKCRDIEELLEICPNSGLNCNINCKLTENTNNNEGTKYKCVNHDFNSSKINGSISDEELLFSAPKSIKLKTSDANFPSWYKVNSVKEIFQILKCVPDSEHYILLAGNTAQGAYRNKNEIKHYIDIKDIKELRSYYITENSLMIGANITLNEAITILREVSGTNPSFSYARVLADHIELIANVSVRNVGTLAGNLILKKDHPEFPSDIFLIFETVGAFIKIENEFGSSDVIKLKDYLNVNMYKKVITKVIIPSLPQTSRIKTYKIMPRSQNAPAILNAGFSVNLDDTNNYKIISRPTIIFGAISSNFVHAKKLELFLIGKNLLNDSLIKEALKILENELMEYNESSDTSFKYKSELAKSLFYKFILSIKPVNLNFKYESGANGIERSLSRGNQEYSTDKTKWPLSKPIPKVEALSQCAGEIEYVNDIPSLPNELQGALVLTKLSTGRIDAIDLTQALKLPGVYGFYSAKDIPGKNTFLSNSSMAFFEKEELFCGDKVLYAGQPVGIIVAETREIALNAADEVIITYSDIKKPQITIKDVINSGDESKIFLTNSYKPLIPPDKSFVKYTITGTVECPSQYHFTMELQSCLCVPSEGELNVYSSTQWITAVQEGISVALNIPQNKINVSTKRLGGGYGCKIGRASMVATACALASYISNRPVRLVLNIETNMAAIGKRCSCYAEYEAGVNESGKIQYLNFTVYEDNGIHLNEPYMSIVAEGIKNIYDSTNWSFNGYDIKTDKASNAWTRAPGTVESLTIIETVMEHIASVTKMSPLEVRLVNANKEDKLLLDMITDLYKSSNFKKRKDDIDLFNSKNRWKKRGISLIPMTFRNVSFGPFHILISVYAQDGTVAVSHGGIEIGQGLNTKLSQVVAAKLGIEVESVSIKATNSLTSPNNTLTGASTTTENICRAALMACDEMLLRLEPIRKKLDSNSTWLELIKKAFEGGVDLVVVTQAHETGGFKQSYNSYGVAVSEVEIDVLTGSHTVIRTDILEDAGESISPGIDIGQVEGAFIMGLGLFTSEQLIYDDNTGEIKTNRTWNYHPPGARDIPADLRITLLKNVSNPEGVLGSKATGEPPLCLAASVLFALRNAVTSARNDSGQKDTWFELNPPLTPEKIFMNCLISSEDLKLYSL